MGHERERTLPIDTDCLAALESRIGYRFRDRALLCRALTHSSYSNETGQRNHHLLCNERLEFLGDSVLSLVVSEFLFTTYRELPEADRPWRLPAAGYRGGENRGQGQGKHSGGRL